MGSFDVTCGLSNLSIREGDRAGLILLNSVTNSFDKLVQGRSLITYHNDLYRPFFTPIYGKYNDYGSLEDIEENVSTQILEEIFAIPIQAIVAIVTTDERSIYSEYNPISEAYGLDSNVFAYGRSTHDSFVALGFLPIIKDSLYEYEGYMLSKEANNTWNIMQESTNIKGLAGFGFQEMFEIFGDVTGVYPGYSKEHTSRIRTLRALSGMFFHARVWDELKALPLDDWSLSGATRFAEEWVQYMKDLKTAETDEKKFFFARNEYVGRNQRVDPQYYPHYLKYEDSVEMLEMSALDAMMTNLNRMYAPTLYAGQGDGYDAMKQLLVISQNILTERTAEYDM